MAANGFVTCEQSSMVVDRRTQLTRRCFDYAFDGDGSLVDRANSSLTVLTAIATVLGLTIGSCSCL